MPKETLEHRVSRVVSVEDSTVLVPVGRWRMSVIGSKISDNLLRITKHFSGVGGLVDSSFV